MTQDQTALTHYPHIGKDKRAGTALPGRGHHEAMALQVAAQHLGHSSDLKHSGEEVDPRAVLHCLDPNLKRQKDRVIVMEYVITVLNVVKAIWFMINTKILHNIKSASICFWFAANADPRE